VPGAEAPPEGSVEPVPRRLPVPARGLHGDMGTAVRGAPVTEREQLGRGRAERAHRVGDRRSGPDAGAGDDGLLMHVQAGTLRVNDVHEPLLGEVASAWSPRGRSLEGALSGSLPVAAVRGARGAPGPTTIRAL